jgi:putative copper resistance protein D
MVNDGPAGSLHVIGDVVHLLAAGVWLGALLPLAILVLHSLCQQDAVDAQTIYHGLDGFSGIGLAVVAILILTGLINSWFLIGLSHWRELFTTAYGIALLVKLGFFFGMLALAALNRFHLTPRLNVAIEQGRSIAVSLGSLRRSVLIETGLALFVLAAVSVLGTLEPPISGG